MKKREIDKRDALCFSPFIGIVMEEVLAADATEQSRVKNAHLFCKVIGRHRAKAALSNDFLISELFCRDGGRLSM